LSITRGDSTNGSDPETQLIVDPRDAAVGDVNGARKDALAERVDNLTGGGSDSRFGRQNRTPFHKPRAELEGIADFIEPPMASVGPRFNR
jgi:hypothetical protein